MINTPNAQERAKLYEEISSEKSYNQICNKQGWSEESQIIHLEGFIRDKGLFAEFAAYAAKAAEEENEPLDTSTIQSRDRLE